MSGRPALVGLVALWCLCLQAVRPAARRLVPGARSALLSFGLSLAMLLALAGSGALDGLAPGTPAGEAEAAERRAAVARSIARALAEGEAAWRRGRAQAEGAQSMPAIRSDPRPTPRRDQVRSRARGGIELSREHVLQVDVVAERPHRLGLGRASLQEHRLPP